jgi:predicted ferric reductase
MDMELLGPARGRPLVTPRLQRRDRYRSPAVACAALLAANAIVIVWLWGGNGNLASVHNWGDLAASVGRLTGLLSAYLALVQILLLARLPWLERLLGFDGLTMWHRRNGKLTLYLVLAHVVFITIGYATMDRVNISTEIGRLLSSYPGMVAAVVGTLLMIAVVVTSLVIARRRLRYETWYFVHLTVYAGIALAWFHQIPTGNELSANPLAASYWTSLYLVTAVLLVWFRLVMPVFQTGWYQLRVTAVTNEGPGVVSLHITGRHLDRLQARPGQFFLWRFLTRDRWWEAHPFSLSAAPNGQTLRITVKAVGDFTRRIGTIAPGTRVLAEGPFGVFTEVARDRERVLFIAGGIGITPIRAMLETMEGDLILIYRVARKEDLIFRDELERLARRRGIALFFVVGDHATPEGRDLLSPSHLRRLIPDIADRDVYLCGPRIMMQLVERHLRRAGVPTAAIHSERFAL